MAEAPAVVGASEGAPAAEGANPDQADGGALVPAGSPDAPAPIPKTKAELAAEAKVRGTAFDCVQENDLSC